MHSFIKGSLQTKKMTSFESFKLGGPILAAIKKLGFTTPTKIQEESIPHIVNGEDVIGQSATGSGKTLAFGCGIVESAVFGGGLQALILTPTRELAEQVKQELSKLTRLRVAAVYGGMSMNPQIRAMEKAEIVVATPGRLLDHINKRTINTSKINMVVLDEADRMLDMGFITDVEKIIRACPKERQTIFFSATISTRIEKLTKKYMKNPVRVSVETHVDPSKLKQIFYNVSKNAKLSLLVHLMNEPYDLAMVFCNTRRTTDLVAKTLKSKGIDAMAIHGGFEQNKRARTIASFNKGHITVLVCTDVAARGIHIDNVSHVFNYDIPRDSTDYVHRIGRTARAGETGKVINFVSDKDKGDFASITKKYRQFSIRKIETPKVEKVIPATEERKSRDGKKARTGSKGGRVGKPKRKFSRGTSSSSKKRPSNKKRPYIKKGPVKKGSKRKFSKKRN